MNRYFYLISYDISDNNRRTRVSRFLMQFGKRIQYSLYEFYLTEKEFSYVKKEIKSIIDSRTDRIRYWQICKSCLYEIDVYGSYEISKEDPFYYIC